MRPMKIKVTVSGIHDVADDMTNEEIAQKLGRAFHNLLTSVNLPHDFIEVDIEPLQEEPEKPRLQVVDRFLKD